MKYVVFNGAGNIAGFYTDDLHENIPSDAIPISEDQWIAYSSNGCRSYKRAESGDEPARLKTQQEMDAEEAGQTPSPKTPDQERMDQLEQLVADLASLQLGV